MAYSRHSAGYQMPLTPPDFMPGYQSGSDGSMHHQHMYRGYPEKRSFDYADSYRGVYTQNNAMSQPVSYASAPMYNQPQHSYRASQPQYSGVPPPGLTHPNQMYPQSHSAIRLPEIPISKDPTAHRQLAPVQQLMHRPREQPRRQQKEEKVVGGVSAHLDYEMDQMADFVHQMVIGMLKPTLSNLPQFKKFVSQILSSTRLPSSTILLGLSHLDTRPTELPFIHPIELCDQDVHRLLTMALLLASKFLDDNTFQNKSWAEVTGLPVAELNRLEAVWLNKIGWRLHVRADEPHGFNYWVSTWDSFRTGSIAPRPAPLLSPIITEHIASSMSSPSQFSPYYAPQYTPQYTPLPNLTHERIPPAPIAAPAYDSWSYPPKLSNDHSPLSAPPTGPSTPEYFGMADTWGMPSYQLRPMQSMQVQQNIYQQQNMLPSYSCWHNIGCTCGSCQRNKEFFFNAPSYGQPVIS